MEHPAPAQFSSIPACETGCLFERLLPVASRVTLPLSDFFPQTMSIPVSSKILGAAQEQANALYVDGREADLTPLRQCHQLQELRIDTLNPAAGTLPPPPRLRALSIRWFGLDSLSPLLSLGTLSTLHLWQFSRLKTLKDIGALPDLKHLLLHEGPQAGNGLSLEGVGTLAQLEIISLRGPMSVATLAPLAGHPTLHTVELFAAVKDRSLAPLAKIPRLRRIIMWETERHYPLSELAIPAVLDPQLFALWLHPRNSFGLPCSHCKRPQTVLPGLREKPVCASCAPDKLRDFEFRFAAFVERQKALSAK